MLGRRYGKPVTRSRGLTGTTVPDQDGSLAAVFEEPPSCPPEGLGFPLVRNADDAHSVSFPPVTAILSPVTSAKSPAACWISARV